MTDSTEPRTWFYMEHLRTGNVHDLANIRWRAHGSADDASISIYLAPSVRIRVGDAGDYRTDLAAEITALRLLETVAAEVRHILQARLDAQHPLNQLSREPLPLMAHTSTSTSTAEPAGISIVELGRGGDVGRGVIARADDERDSPLDGPGGSLNEAGADQALRDLGYVRTGNWDRDLHDGVWTTPVQLRPDPGLDHETAAAAAPLAAYAATSVSKIEPRLFVTALDDAWPAGRPILGPGPELGRADDLGTYLDGPAPDLVDVSNADTLLASLGFRRTDTWIRVNRGRVVRGEWTAPVVRLAEPTTRESQ